MQICFIYIYILLLFLSWYWIDEETPQPCPCQRTALCCRLGRKAVRLSYTASVYTCKIEALAQGLKYQKAASHRLFKSNTGQADRMDATNTLRMSYGFRWRLKLCETQGKVQKRCFQECCERRLKEEQARAKIVRPQAKPKSSSNTKAKEKDEKRP